jgi:hypothetical protein
MIAATIHLYDNPEEVGFWGWVEDPENRWIIFIELDRQMQFYRVVDPEKPVTMEQEGEWHWIDEQLVGGRGITHSTAISIILNGGYTEMEVDRLLLDTLKKNPPKENG